MIASLKNMLSGLLGSASAQPAALQPRPHPQRQVEADVVGKPAPPPPAAAAKVVQRALIAANGAVAGFEFRVDPAASTALALSADPFGQAAHVSSVLTASRLTAVGRRVGLARIPAAWLQRATPAENEVGTWIAVEFDPAHPLSPDALARIQGKLAHFREMGAKLGWDVTQQFDLTPDFWLLRARRAQPVQGVLDVLKTLAAQNKGVPAIALDLASLEDIEQGLQGGLLYASGNMEPAAAAPPPPGDTNLSPAAGRVARMLGQLASGADTAAVVGALKSDVGLTVRLLQQVNSARFAHLGGVASIDQAIALLGRDELQRWLLVVLTQYGDQRKLSAALQEMALFRARLLELLAIERGEAQPGLLFTLGLASELGLILKIGTLTVAKQLGLPPEAAQALTGSGPWHVYLRTAKQLEDQTTSDASATADGFGSSARLLKLSEEAWAWAEQTRVPTTGVSQH
jgi:EAL and modified HD-GYP domain-containing signal transduction protein